MLRVTPDDPKLWCALGDVTGDTSHYEAAWARSGRRSARAQRSLARAALKRKDWGAAAGHFELALALSPLYPDAWFSLGYCYLRTDREAKARQAFTKLTQLEPDHGEGWANLAALWLQAGQWQQALSASEQAVKHKRESWQAWENYAAAALRAGALTAAARGVQQVLQLSEGRRLPAPLLAGLVDGIEGARRALEVRKAAAAAAAVAAGEERGEGEREAADGRPQQNGQQQAEEQQQEQQEQQKQQQQQQQQEQQQQDEEGEEMEAPGELLGLLRMAQALPGDTPRRAGGPPAAAAATSAESDERQLAQAAAAAGAALKAAANAPACGPEVWGLLGRWYALQGEATSAKEALLKQVRALQGSPFAREPAAFAEMAAASAQMADAYLALVAVGQGGARDLSAARMHLRGVLRQAEEAFGGGEAHEKLQGKLREVEAAEAEFKAKAAAAAGSS
ncbi:putative Tetratricopeptide repeat like protein 27 [Monoraphidium neglectum]|uniref:Putative Tetratricopeptide repeat like protein 27 n=1 Tax=Monoraphidium neglectum TaxID=145388 RepID=A0A0D2LP14_9CHLO|nr:putative Tetratricopeptide repeat like protein 27 [Monoraphidium neglectum]KIY91721.1 putative Tetratricopeptide repeat like protein 27 [Monoraphidium neglectum]|eukprot:XP_013890741.1 putative Tetratricopeptide repeat like protein 27 [Monoraphidium neglectum]